MRCELPDEVGGSIPPQAAKINNMGNLRDEIAYLEYGKKFAELSAGEQREVEYQYDDLIGTFADDAAQTKYE